MAISFPLTTPERVIEKVLRRAEVAKIARKLHDRLALASYKAQNGQENLSFRDVEARLEATIQRKRVLSRIDTSSTYSSSSSERLSYNQGLASSPLTAPLFSDDVGTSSKPPRSRKRQSFHADYNDMELPTTKRLRSYSMAPPNIANARSSWKSTHKLPQSSPARSRHGLHFSTMQGPNISFASEISTIPDSPTFGHMSEDEDESMLRHSYRSSRSHKRSSPPRTPPSTHRRTRSGVNGAEGADLLLYLATSPSPAKPAIKHNRLIAPSTPPSHDHNHFAAALNTPSILGLSTPGQQFNFAEFCNVTPSPAQGAFGSRTPGPAKTPSAAKETKRRLNFDSLAPPGTSNPD